MSVEPRPEADKLAYAVIGAAIEVHRVLGPGLLEGVYEASLGVELEQRGIPFQRQLSVPLEYKGIPVGVGRLDLLVGEHEDDPAERVVVEIKAVEAIAYAHVAQALTYLRATGCEIALVVNFHARVLREGIKRLVLTKRP